MNKKALFSLFLVVFLDLLGVGIIIPILAPNVLDPVSGFVPHTWDATTRSIALGLLLASYPLAQFIGAPILGKLSDHYGRKPILRISLVGTALGYMLFAFAIQNHMFGLMIASRILDGVTGGNIAVANSAIADLSPTPQDKAKNFGMIGMAFGMGFILGPSIGGILSDSTVVSWFNPALPFWFAAGLSLINQIFITFFFKETLQHRAELDVSLWSGFKNILKAFNVPHLRTMFLVTFLHSLGFTFFTFFFPVLLVQRFGLGESQIGLLFGYVGFWIALAQGVLNRWLVHRMKSEDILKSSIFMLALSLLGVALAPKIWFLFIIQPLVAIFEGITFPNITTVISHQSSEKQQGEVLGIVQSLRALAEGITPLISGVLVLAGPATPTFVSAGVLTVCGLVYSYRARRNHSALGILQE